MRLTIGESIKALRRERGITQEELANILGVAPQSISRWENSSCYPDMELLPDIAEFFEVTVDKLMGVDKRAEQKEIDLYLDRFQEAVSRGAVYECIEIAREGVAAYPNSYALLNKLMYALFISGDDDGNLPEWHENMLKYDAEITELGERIMKYCADADIRTEAANRLAFNHCEMGRKDMGRRIFESMPTIYECREMNIYWALDEGERLKNARELIGKAYNILSSSMINLSSREGISGEERITILEKVIDLRRLLFGEDALLDCWAQAHDYTELAKAYAHQGKMGAAIAALEAAFKYAKAFDGRPDTDTHTTLLLGEITLKRTDFDTGDSRPLCEIMRDKWLASSDFDSLRDTEDFQTAVSGKI